MTDKKGQSNPYIECIGFAKSFKEIAKHYMLFGQHLVPPRTQEKLEKHKNAFDSASFTDFANYIFRTNHFNHTFEKTAPFYRGRVTSYDKSNYLFMLKDPKETVKKLLQENKAAKLIYLSGDDKLTARYAFPISLKNNTFKVITSKGIRNFQSSRIKSVASLDRKYVYKIAAELVRKDHLQISLHIHFSGGSWTSLITNSFGSMYLALYEMKSFYSSDENPFYKKRIFEIETGARMIYNLGVRQLKANS